LSEYTKTLEQTQAQTTAPSPVAEGAQTDVGEALQGGEPLKEEHVKKAAVQDDRQTVGPGMLVSVYEKVLDTTPKGEARERVQIFRGVVLARKHGREIGATITVRKESGGIGVEKIFPVYSPIVEKIRIEKVFKHRRSKLYFLRTGKKKLREAAR
jgi:large subunit ribosomal protein L19